MTGANVVYEFAHRRVDPARRELLHNGKPVTIYPRCFDALLLLIEPVFAGFVASIRGDVFSATQLAGAGLILAAVILAETLPEWLDRRVNSREAGLDNDRSQPVPVAD